MSMDTAAPVPGDDGPQDMVVESIPAFAQEFLSGPSVIPRDCIQWENTAESLLGKGSFGYVYRGLCRGMQVAIKIPRKKHFSNEELADFQSEMTIWSRLFHPNICLFMGACITEGVILVTEMLAGSLDQLMSPKNKISLCSLMCKAKQGAQAISWLHTQDPPIIHRDIKPSNFLFDAAGVVKVCDFGLAQLLPKGNELRDEPDHLKGTSLYMSPEVLRGDPVTPKADVYAFALVLWGMVTRKTPFASFRGRGFDAFKQRVLHGHRERTPSSAPESLRTLIRECWAPDPERRPTMTEVCRRLEEVIVHAAIPSERGAMFWLKHFHRLGHGTRLEVPWTEFAAAFYAYFGMAHVEDEVADHYAYAEMVDGGLDLSLGGYVDADMMDEGWDAPTEDEQGPQASPQACLHHHLLKTLCTTRADANSAPMVNIETFGRFLACLGPIGDDVNAFMAKVVATCREPWFFGECDTADAVRLLLVAQRGSFLVRLSSHPSMLGWLVVSKLNRNGTVIHVRVAHEPGGPTYTLEGDTHEYESMEDLLKNSRHLHVSMTAACAGSKFQHVFHLYDRKCDQKLSVAGYRQADDIGE